jgi:hypothetical protein
MVAGTLTATPAAAARPVPVHRQSVERHHNIRQNAAAYPGNPEEPDAGGRQMPKLATWRSFGQRPKSLWETQTEQRKSDRAEQISRS